MTATRRGVDAAGQADHHVGEAVLLDVVAGAEHQRLVHLVVAAEEVGDRRLPADSRVGGRRGDVGDPGQLDQRELLVGRPATRVEQPLAVDRLHVEVDHQQVLDELGRAGEQLAVRVEGDGPAVEDQLVLAADLVHVDERAGRVGGAGGEHPLPLGLLALGVGRGVEVEDHLGAAVGLVGDRARRVPRVLADGHTRRARRRSGRAARAGAPARSSGARRRPRSSAARTCGTPRRPRHRRTPRPRSRGRGRGARTRPPPHSPRWPRRCVRGPAGCRRRSRASATGPRAGSRWSPARGRGRRRSPRPRRGAAPRGSARRSRRGPRPSC